MLRYAFAPNGKRILAGNFARQQYRGIFFYENLFLKGQTVQFHEFVGVTGVAIFAGEFAAAIGIDGPVERDASGFAFIEDGLHRQQKILRACHRLATAGNGRGNRSEAGDADQRRGCACCSKSSILPEILQVAERIAARGRKGSRRAIRAATDRNDVRNDTAWARPRGKRARPCARAMIRANRKERSWGKWSAAADRKARRVG